MGANISLRPSLLGNNPLSKASGVSHLTEKSASQIIYLQKQQSSNKKRDSKVSNDYYTVQNTRNPSSQPSVQQTSRNHTGNKNSSIIGSQTVTSSSNEPTPQQQPRHYNGSSTTSIGIINSFSHEISLEKSQSCVSNFKQSSGMHQRHSIQHHDRCKLIKVSVIENLRALSQSKTNNSQFGQSASSNALSSVIARQKHSHKFQNHHLTHQGPSFAYNDKHLKHSMLQPHLHYSPKPLDSKHANAVYRSPQSSKKISQPIISLLNNQSPLPKNHIKQPSSRISTAGTENIKSHQRNNHSKIIGVKGQSTCLQIDLSSLSTKNDDDLNYGLHNGLAARKQNSISQAKKTPIELTSNSPQLSSQFSAKSPTTYKQSSNRHSILHNFSQINSSKAKQTTPKIFEASLNMQKNLTQKFNAKDKIKKLTTEQLKTAQRAKQQEKRNEYENFSFTSNQSPILEVEVLEERSNILTSKQSLISAMSQPNLQKIQQVTSPIRSLGQSKERSVKRKDSQPMSTASESLPYSKRYFLEKYQQKLLQYEIDEIKKMKEERIYFHGQALEKSQAYINMIKGKKEDQIKKELDDEEGYYNVLLGDHLMYRYEIIKILGKGSFAQVACCKDHKTGQKVAIKITRNTEIDHKFAQSESKLLNFLMKNDPQDKNNIVRLIDEFYFRDHHCFVFELLKSDLFEHLKATNFLGFETSKIRSYTQQILQALVFLEQHSLIHCDLKPENILLVDSACEKLKIVDYGSGCFKGEQVYTYVQSRFYRAPEVILRVPYTEKVDMWSLGCIMVELYTGEPLFPGNNEQEQLELIMEICGIPPASLIDRSRKKQHYFDTDYSPYLIEDEELGILRIPESKQLTDIINCDDPGFIDFIKRCLVLEPDHRWSAQEAINHPWLQQGPARGLKAEGHGGGRQRGREEDALYHQEESPVRIEIEVRTKKPLTKHFKFQAVKVAGLEDYESELSSPKDEGHPPPQITTVDHEPIITEQEVNKPHSGSLIQAKKATPSGGDIDHPQGVKLLAKYEILRDSVERESHSRTSGIASEANIPPVNQHEIVSGENTINKITVTFYQKRQKK